jgi:hypothetical protein
MSDGRSDFLAPVEMPAFKPAPYPTDAQVRTALATWFAGDYKSTLDDEITKDRESGMRKVLLAAAPYFDHEAFAWALGKIRALGLHQNNEHNAGMMDRLEAMQLEFPARTQPTVR